jgi:hypothetical protein
MTKSEPTWVLPPKNVPTVILSRAKDPAGQPLADIIMDSSLRSE